MNNREWFKQAKFGMMVHFGLYSLLGGEYRGKRTMDIAEWIQSHYRIPNAEYEQLAKLFNHIYFDAAEWVQLAQDAGMEYMVVTAKHHEGFAMFKSEYDDFNVVDGTPFGRDIIGELSEACRKHGLKFGLYYSQAIDWREMHGGGYSKGHSHPDANNKRGTIAGLEDQGSAWCNDWDFPDNNSKDYTICFEKKIKPQLKEILTKYGELCLIWFDTPIDISDAQSKEIYDMVKEYQPNCLVNSRIGNGMGDYRSWGDNQIPDEYMTEGLFESPATLNTSWGYKYFDNNWKDANRVAEIKEHLNSRGINYLLNVGPDHLGRIPGPSIDILREVGRLAKK